jgi:23S rRNA (adenine2503-C2)-methyltransferase
VSFEWAVIEGVNDTVEQAQALAARLLGLGAHVNLIPLNPVLGYGGQPSGGRRMGRFVDELDRQRVQYSIRTRRGIDIQAGCGQLASRHRSDP